MKAPTPPAVGPEVEPFPEMPHFDALPELDDPPSFCTIHSDHGLGLTLWSIPNAATIPSDKPALDVRLELAPDRSVIIGRMEGGRLEYLDPRYVPTPIVPGSGATILRNRGGNEDIYVSRGHFLMRGHAGGILLVNGVPRRGGGIRPPMNGTLLVAPQRRPLKKAEEYLIERGSAATIRLPNGTQLTLQAE